MSLTFSWGRFFCLLRFRSDNVLLQISLDVVQQMLLYLAFRQLMPECTGAELGVVAAVAIVFLASVIGIGLECGFHGVPTDRALDQTGKQVDAFGVLRFFDDFMPKDDPLPVGTVDIRRAVIFYTMKCSSI